MRGGMAASVTQALALLAVVVLAVLVAVHADPGARELAVYADNNASTPAFPEVVQAVASVTAACYANPSSVHALGRRSRELLDACRRRFAELLGARQCEVVFTSGATEANNAAIRGLFAAQRASGGGGGGAPRRRFRVVTSNVEHASVYQTLRSLPEREAETVPVPVGPDGRLPPEAVVEALEAAPTDMVCVILANNEVGTIQDIAPVAEACRARGVHLHLDVTQVVGRYPLDLHALGCDTATLSAHKFHGPKGVGALFVRDGVRFDACATGGGQEMSWRSGTENLAGIRGAVVALERCAAELASGGDARVRAMRDHVEAALLAGLPPGGVRVNGAGGARLYNTLSVSFPGVNSRAQLVPALDEARVYVNVGCACSQGKPSATLQALGLTPEEQQGSIRVSFGFMNTPQEARKLARALLAAVRLARAAPAAAPPS